MGTASREALVAKVERELGPFDPVHLHALLAVPRERFVRPEDIAVAGEDRPLPLDESGLATISAPHAYLLSFRLLALRAGDALLELGSGTGYGAALASYIVGREGHVTTVEIDAHLASRARSLLEPIANVTVLGGDATTSAALFAGVKKIVCTFAVAEIPPPWLDALEEGAVLVAPVGAPERDQRLLRVERRGGRLITSDHGGVRYVPNRASLSS